ncbi:MAG: TonB-dependent receptor [Saprospiraceae bacterium]|nr:TonB-dependent receptor [Saprospiraceae bacterium]
MKKVLFIIILSSLSAVVFSQSKEFTISGYIKDKKSGETLIGASVSDLGNPQSGTITNTYGFYSLTLPQGVYKIGFSYLGYTESIREIELNKNIQINIELNEGVVIEEIVISAQHEERRKNVEGTQMGTVELPMENIKKMPAIFGETDILKTLQLLPGVLSSGEGNAGFFVRGGGPDQNLVLLDEALVYNTGHLLGFFSVFNTDAIKNTTLIKGGMPANYGGRLSSVLDIQMKEGNLKKYSVEGGIGLISSRITAQGPVVKDKSSFMISGRRTYILDLIQPFLKGSSFEGTNYYFYDINTKWNYIFSEKDRIYFSGYFGKDVLKFRQPTRDFVFDLPYGNSTGTLRWNHVFTQKLFMNMSLIYNDYRFQVSGGQDNFSFKLFSGVKDWNLKTDFDYYLNPRHSLKYGINYTYHTLTPNTASATTGEVNFETGFKPKNAHETGVYFLDDMKLTNKIFMNTGLRLSLFSQIGPYTSLVDGTQYAKGDHVKTYGGIEPRWSLNYRVNKELSIKSGVSVTTQYIHLVSNSASTLPADVWVPSTELVKPQRGIQYALGVFKNFKNDMYETSFEVYYKDLQNQIDYADNYVNDISKDLENSFVFGKGRAYGAEFFVKKSLGKWNGWIGYSLARTERSFENIEGGRWYPAVYDKAHDLKIVANYQINKKWDCSAVFIYGSGRWFTPVRGFFFVEQNINLFYGPRNSTRLDAYHRMDLSVTYTPKAGSKKPYQGSWILSIYNTYNRKNPFFVNFDVTSDFETGATTIEGTKITIFPIIPSITYNFKWNQK